MSAGLEKLGRQSFISLAGSILSALAGFLLVFVATNSLGAEQTGSLLLAVALFNIIARVALLGTASGLVRFVSRARATKTTADIDEVLRWALIPVGVVGVAVALLVIAFASPLAGFLANDIAVEQLASNLRAAAPFLPAAALMFALLGATRGFSSMRPTVLVDRIARPLMQLLAVAVLLLIGAGTTSWTVAWLAPYVIAVALAAIALNELRSQRLLQGHDESLSRASFWKFTTPQWGVDFIRVVVRWQDTLLIGILLGPTQAAIYAAVTRLVKLASLVNQSLVETVAPQVSEAIAAEDTDRVKTLYQASTGWLILGVFPIYLVTALYAEPLSKIFGPEFSAGASALAILSIGRLLGTATGPVEAVLTMSGRSATNLSNHLVSLFINIGLTLLLVPKLGLPGAAIAWVASILVTNYGPLFQVFRSTGLHPFGPATTRAIPAVCAGFIIPAVFLHLVSDPGLAIAGLGTFASAIAVSIWAWYNRELLALDELRKGGRANRNSSPTVGAS
ncbi:MAG: polysaccharide biosynthesis C-terminal domain-containing protein [Acidimicrobiales bacterium]